MTSLREHIKQQVAELKLATPHFKEKRFSRELYDACFVVTPNCRELDLRTRLYWILNDIEDYRKCVGCGSEITSKILSLGSKYAQQKWCTKTCRMTNASLRKLWDDEREQRTGFRNAVQVPEIKERIAKTNLERYGHENVSKNETIKQRIRDSVMTKYGVDNVNKVPAFREKQRNTNLIRYGVTNPLLSPEIQSKIELTNIKRYGSKFPIQNLKVQEKKALTNLSKYGVKYPSHTEKGRETSFLKYGVRHPMQNYEVFQRCMKARFKIKTYQGRTGTIKYQGYEDVALKYLHETLGIELSEINCNRSLMPRVFYYNSTKKKRARYYPDIYVKNAGMFIEVKSWYTYNMNRVETHEKQAACKAAGFDHIILICDKNKIIKLI